MNNYNGSMKNLKSTTNMENIDDNNNRNINMNMNRK
jgi:hypothetical protein